jgi:D-3-phosphoglycerate dehydrogenase / 2-oxoglutarate reductase
METWSNSGLPRELGGHNRAVWCTMILARTMTDSVDYLILDLLEWMGTSPRPYSEVLDAWRTSCPRLPVWEEANDRGYIERHHASGTGQSVSVSTAGVAHLRMHRLPASLRS